MVDSLLQLAKRGLKLPVEGNGAVAKAGYGHPLFVLPGVHIPFKVIYEQAVLESRTGDQSQVFRYPGPSDDFQFRKPGWRCVFGNE